MSRGVKAMCLASMVRYSAISRRASWRRLLTAAAWRCVAFGFVGCLGRRFMVLGPYFGQHF